VLKAARWASKLFLITPKKKRNNNERLNAETENCGTKRKQFVNYRKELPTGVCLHTILASLSPVPVSMKF
jgi:hypothetical protein